MYNIISNMTHIASVLAVATVFIIGFWTVITTLIFIAREGGGIYYARQKYLCTNFSYYL